MKRRYLLPAVWVALFVLLTKLTVGVVLSNGYLLNTDLWFENLLLAYRTPLFLQVFSAITLLGSTIVIVGVLLLAGTSLFYSRFHAAYVVGLATAVIGAGGSIFVLKTIIERARPTGLIPSIIETSSSFPSGHATFSMALYGFLAYFLCKHYPKYSVLFIAGSSLIIILTAFSRLYLGVHFPSDVLAGLALGGLWLLVGIEITKRLLSKPVSTDFVREV